MSIIGKTVVIPVLAFHQVFTRKAISINPMLTDQKW